MTQRPLVALGTDNPNVRQTIKDTLENHFQALGNAQVLEIPTDAPEYSAEEGVEPLLNQALRKAAEVRIKHTATVGIAGAWGYITLREKNKTTALWFPTFFAVSTSAERLLSVSFPFCTCPPDTVTGLAGALDKVIATTHRTTEEPSKELFKIGALATSAWVKLDFPKEQAIRFFLH